MIYFIAILGWAALFALLRYRVHFTMTCQMPSARRAKPVAAPAQVVPTLSVKQAEQMEDLVSALQQQGCTRKQARIAAEKAIATGSIDFDTLFRRAIKETA